MEFIHSSKSILSGISKSFINDADFRNHFYTYDPQLETSWTERIEKLKSQNRNNEKLASALKEINENMGASSETLKNIHKLNEVNTLCVVTGQQTGILGGPLFTLYKAASAIKKAKALSKKYSISVIPIFWMASEDHDFEEAREIGLLDDGKLKKVSVDKKPGCGSNNPYKTDHNYSYLKEPVGWIDINTSVKSLLIESGHVAGGAAYEEWCREVFTETARSNETLSQWFGRIYLQIFKDEGLVVIDPMHAKIRALGTDFLKTAAEVSESIIGSVIKKGEELETLGYEPLIKPREGATGLYFLERGERLPLTVDKEFYTVRENDDRVEYSLDELKKHIEKKPEEFSTNVILRPVIQDVYLPTIAYVAGPGEASYYAQLKQVYEYFDLEMPIILPRENYTVCCERLKVDLGKLELSFDDVLLNDQIDTENKLLKSRDQMDVDGLFDTFKLDFDDKYKLLVDQLESIDSDINAISKKNYELIHQQFNYLKQKSHRFHRRNHKDELKTVKGIYQWFKPFGAPQERTLSLINILCLAGPEFISYITNELEYDYNHRVIVLE